MKPFDLEAALAGAPVVTRDGRKVTELHLFEADVDYPLVVYVEGSRNFYIYTRNGKSPYDAAALEIDLVMAPTKREGWVNIYKQYSPELPRTVCCLHPTEEVAKKFASSDVVATVKVEWEEEE